jgi:hypothetical protein
MTAKEIVHSIKRILSKSVSSNDSRFSDLHILHVFNGYREIFIEDHIGKTREVPEVLYQNFGLVNKAIVGSGDDPNVIGESVKLGKFEAPPLVAVPFGLNHKIRSSSRQSIVNKVGLNELMLMVRYNDETLTSNYFYAKESNSVYWFPSSININFIGILQDPLKGIILMTGYVDYVEEGISYTVYDGAITYNGLSYTKGQLFSGVQGVSTFTGIGKLGYTQQKRQFGWNDQYPITGTIAQQAAINVITKDFGVEAGKNIDIDLDNLDE